MAPRPHPFVPPATPGLAPANRPPASAPPVRAPAYTRPPTQGTQQPK
jgi:hypothetical protein